MNPTLFICTECGNDYCTNAGTNRTCINCGGFKAKSKPITNADHIRAMTDEDLAAWIVSVAQGGDGSCAPGCHVCDGRSSCTEPWLDWLRQEVSDG